jgi:phospholipid transport system substrate-binding protein
MNRLNFGRKFIRYLLTLTLLCGSDAIAGAPTDMVKSTVDQVIKILTDPRYKGDAKKEERRKLLRETIFPHFDFQEMAKRSLGAEWGRRTAEEQKDFVKIFTDFVEKTSVKNIESYDGEKFIYTGERIKEPYAVVVGKILATDGDETTIDYMLDRMENEWEVYDLVVAGISFVSNYRSQFARLIRESSYGGLVRRLREKLADKRP